MVNVHRADRLVEVIDASETDRVRAKRTLLRFGELRASHRLDQTDPPQQDTQARAKRAQTSVGQPPPRARRRHRQRRARVELIADVAGR